MLYFSLVALNFLTPNRESSHTAMEPLHLTRAAEHTGEGMKMARLSIYCFEV